MRGDGVQVTCPVCSNAIDKRGLSHHVGKHDVALSLERFWSHVDKTGECWVWTASLGSTGYGQFRINPRTYKAHRWIWQQINGPLDPKLQIDHLCRNRPCVRPSHMEAVTPGENYRRGMHPSAVAHRTGKCRFGHDLTSLRSQPTVQRCMECVRIRETRQRQGAAA